MDKVQAFQNIYNVLNQISSLNLSTALALQQSIMITAGELGLTVNQEGKIVLIRTDVQAPSSP